MQIFHGEHAGIKKCSVRRARLGTQALKITTPERYITTIVYWDYIGLMEKRIETYIYIYISLSLSLQNGIGHGHLWRLHL